MFEQCCKSKKREEIEKKKKVKTKIVVYDYRSLFCLHFENSFRKRLVNFTCSHMFENIVILLILINSVVLAIYDYKDRDNETDWNIRLERMGEVLTILFTIEMLLKILA